MNINFPALYTVVYVHVMFWFLKGSKVYAAIHTRNITPAFTVIVILNV